MKTLFKSIVTKTILSLCLAAPLTAVATDIQLYGYFSYGDTPGNMTAGLYTFSPDSSSAFTLVSSSVNALGGGSFIGDEFYAVKVVPNPFYGGNNINLEKFNTDDWSRISTKNGYTKNIATDLTYDASTSTIYGCFHTYEDGVYSYGTLDFEAPNHNPEVSAYDCLSGLAADADGKLFAIDMKGIFYTITDKATGELDPVGVTGIKSVTPGSACIDRRSGRLFWAAATQSGTSLYELDKTSGAATLILSFPENIKVSALSVYVPDVATDSPDAVRDLAADFQDGSRSGNVSFLMPANSYNGTPLSGALTYTVSVAPDLSVTGTALPSEKVTVPVSVASNGFYDIHVLVSNDAGDGPDSKLSRYIGYDTPSAPTDVSAVYADGKAVVSWSAVSTGINDAFVDPSLIRYKVTRTPDGHVVADGVSSLSVEDQMKWPDAPMAYRYEVTAVQDGMVSEKGVSDKFVVGEVSLPYSQTFDNIASLDPFTIIDGNADRSMWSVGGAQALVYGGEKVVMDDWLITPPVRLESGKVYDFSIDSKCQSGNPERLEVRFGLAPTPEGMNVTVIEPVDVSNPTYKTFEGKLVCPESGLYYVGIHSCGDTPYYHYVDNLSIGIGVAQAGPSAPTEFTAVAAKGGKRSVSLSFVTPSVDMDGKPVARLTKAELYRGETLVKTFDNPSAGTRLEYVDDAAMPGNQIYRAVAYSAGGKGKEAEVEVFVGLNRPVAPASVVASDLDGTVSLKWSAPAEDIDGNSLSAADMTYSVYTRGEDGNEYAVAEGLTKPEYTFKAVEAGQRYMYFGIVAVSEGGNSDAALSEYIPVGKAYPAPYRESFANTSTSHVHGITRISGNAGWQVYDDAKMSGMAALDADNGYLAFVGVNAADAAEIATGKISLASLTAPVLTFNVFNYEVDNLPDDNTIEVFVNDGSGYKSIGTKRMSEYSGWGWHRVSFDLSGYKGKTVSIKLRGRVVTYPQTHIDNMRVYDFTTDNVSLLGVSAPSYVKAGDNVKVSVDIENSGNSDASDLAVSLYSDKRLIDTRSVSSLKAGGFVQGIFNVRCNVADAPVAVYSVVLHYASDMDADDNKCVAEPTGIEVPGYAAPTDLAGEKSDSGYNLKWSAPVLSESLPKAVNEGFESFESFSMTGQNGWKFVDADNLLVSGVLGITFPSLPQPGKGTMSWFVLDDAWEGVASNKLYAAEEGHKYLSNMCLHGEGKVDDWMISPALFGGPQTVSFLARSFSAEYPENLEVLVSYDSAEPGDFKSLESYVKLPASWTRYHVELPDGARYFALRAVSENAFMLHVDDIAFVPEGDAEELTLKGYNVYRDNVLVNSAPVSDCRYSDKISFDDSHEYAVSAVYAEGESGVSNRISFKGTGVDSIYDSSLFITAGPGCLTVCGAKDSLVSVCTLDGISLISEVAGSDMATFAVNPGIYIVKVGVHAVKVVIP